MQYKKMKEQKWSTEIVKVTK